MGYLTSGLGIGLLLLGGAFKLYYDSSQSTIDSLQTQLTTSVANTERLKTVIEDQNEELKQTLANHELIVGQFERMQKENIEAQETVDRMKASLARHNLNEISLRKPKLLQTILNKGTKRVADEFNTLTSGL
tara:strand:+ start:453 stop:848 length:396 start_codon:yes stop_codon:yes gene_type:complete